MSDDVRRRSAEVKRATKETDITLTVDLDGDGGFTGETGVGFLDHMLDLLARHGRLTLNVECSGDLQVDAHHTVEDIGICLGQALAEALGDKAGIARYGMSFVPMDECLARAVLDLSGRPCCVIDAPVSADQVGAFDVELAWEFFEAFSRNGRLNLHLDLLRGGNAHHSIEACFKAVARALADGCAIDPRSGGVLSTKGVL
jgi:imidazoleglycerol-phosphate dehydratase